MHVLDEELTALEEDLGVDAAEVLVVGVEVVGLPAAQTVEVAAVNQGHGDVAGAQRHHVRDLEKEVLHQPVDLPHLHQETAQLDQAPHLQQPRLDDLYERARLHPLVHQLVRPVARVISACSFSTDTSRLRITFSEDRPILKTRSFIT